MDHILLIGAEEVSSGGRAISGAADRIEAAASRIEYASDSFLRRLEDILQLDRDRRQALEVLITVRSGMEADGRYDEEAFQKLSQEMKAI